MVFQLDMLPADGLPLASTMPALFFTIFFLIVNARLSLAVRRVKS